MAAQMSVECCPNLYITPQRLGLSPWPSASSVGIQPCLFWIPKTPY
jgi:hypothetical protein